MQTMPGVRSSSSTAYPCALTVRAPLPAPPDRSASAASARPAAGRQAAPRGGPAADAPAAPCPTRCNGRAGGRTARTGCRIAPAMGDREIEDLAVVEGADAHGLLDPPGQRVNQVLGVARDRDPRRNFRPKLAAFPVRAVAAVASRAHHRPRPSDRASATWSSDAAPAGAQAGPAGSARRSGRARSGRRAPGSPSGRDRPRFHSAKSSFTPAVNLRNHGAVCQFPRCPATLPVVKVGSTILTRL